MPAVYQNSHFIKYELPAEKSLCLHAKFDGAFDWSTERAGAGVSVWYYHSDGKDDRRLLLHLAVPFKVATVSWSAETTAASIAYSVINCIIKFLQRCKAANAVYQIDNR